MAQTTSPLIGIIMGSDSDWPTMKAAADVCKEFGVPADVRVMSAHRTPEDVATFAKEAHTRGMKVIIAGAGGAAHLAGVAAAFSPLPVIAVPIETKLAGGLDSLLAMVQMPSGVPVATVAVGGAKNAGLLAIQILGTGDAEMQKKFLKFKEKIADEARAKNAKLQATM